MFTHSEPLCVPMQTPGPIHFPFLAGLEIRQTLTTSSGLNSVLVRYLARTASSTRSRIDTSECACIAASLIWRCSSIEAS